MRRLFILFLLSSLLACGVRKPLSTPSPAILVLGSVHFPTERLNADSLFRALQRFQPDLILLEADSTNFYPDFTFKHLYDENEYVATVRYVMKNPQVQVRPIEFEGRNAYRKKVGIFSEPGEAFQRVMNEIITQKQLSQREQQLLDKLSHFDRLAKELKNETLQVINQPLSDQVIDSLVYYKYEGLKEIVKGHPVFIRTKMIDSKKDTVRVKDNFLRWAHFEGTLRNEAIASNTLQVIRQQPEKRIVVITGFFHRPYLLKKLKESHIQVTEWKE